MKLSVIIGLILVGALAGCAKPLDNEFVKKMVTTCLDNQGSPVLRHNFNGTVYQVECRSLHQQ